MEKPITTQLLEVLLNMVDDYRSRRFLLVVAFIAGSVYSHLQNWNLPMWLYIVTGAVVSVYVIIETIQYMVRPYEGRELPVNTPVVTSDTEIKG